MAEIYPSQNVEVQYTAIPHEDEDDSMSKEFKEGGFQVGTPEELGVEDEG